MLPEEQRNPVGFASIDNVVSAQGWWLGSSCAHCLFLKRLGGRKGAGEVYLQHC